MSMKYKLFLCLPKWERIRMGGVCLRKVKCPESAEGSNERQMVKSKKIFR
jgi:hypothetical protein